MSTIPASAPQATPVAGAAANVLPLRPNAPLAEPAPLDPTAPPEWLAPGPLAIWRNEIVALAKLGPIDAEIRERFGNWCKARCVVLALRNLEVVSGTTNPDFVGAEAELGRALRVICDAVALGRGAKPGAASGAKPGVASGAKPGVALGAATHG